jgi:hypothetical protein
MNEKPSQSGTFRVSELIAHLEYMKENYGDIPVAMSVRVDHQNGFAPIDELIHTSEPDPHEFEPPSWIEISGSVVNWF